jgi:hypothetical protein
MHRKTGLRHGDAAQLSCFLLQQECVAPAVEGGWMSIEPGGILRAWDATSRQYASGRRTPELTRGQDVGRGM